MKRKEEKYHVWALNTTHLRIWWSKWEQTSSQLWGLSSALCRELLVRTLERGLKRPLGGEQFWPLQSLGQCSSLAWTKAHRKEPKKTQISLLLQHEKASCSPEFTLWISQNTWDTRNGGRSNSFQCLHEPKEESPVMPTPWRWGPGPPYRMKTTLTWHPFKWETLRPSKESALIYEITEYLWRKANVFTSKGRSSTLFLLYLRTS